NPVSTVTLKRWACERNSAIRFSTAIACSSISGLAALVCCARTGALSNNSVRAHATTIPNLTSLIVPLLISRAIVVYAAIHGVHDSGHQEIIWLEFLPRLVGIELRHGLRRSSRVRP